MAKEISEDYASSLADLTVNSKPLINMLTILAEENIDHAEVIVETVDKHLEKVHPDIKLPVLYLVDSIIKNVGGAYTQKFSQIIVNMFTKTFKQVDEKTRSQMFKLRETWHEVFPPGKLYQLDVKVNLIDPAWPIQAQPQAQSQQSTIHLNPNFLKKPVAASSVGAVVPVPHEEEEKMRVALARKEQELLMLQRKKIEMELEQTKRQLEMAEKNVQKTTLPACLPAATPAPIPMINSVVVHPALTSDPDPTAALSVKQRLGPPVNKNATANSGARIAPVSGVMLASVRRDPRLARLHPPTSSIPQHAIAPNVFDIKPLDRPGKVTKRKNVITIDVRTDSVPNLTQNGPRDPRPRRDPRLEKHVRIRDVDDRPRRTDFRDKAKTKSQERLFAIRKRESDRQARKYAENDNATKRGEEKEKSVVAQAPDSDQMEVNNDTISSTTKITMKSIDETLTQFLVADPKKINKLPPIPKINKNDKRSEESAASPTKRKKDSTSRTDKRISKKRDGKDSSDGSPSPEKKLKNIATKESNRSTKHKSKEQAMDVDTTEKSDNEVVTFKELKNYHKERYMRRNKEKSESPDKTLIQETTKAAEDFNPIVPGSETEATNISEIDENKDVDLRQLPPVEPINSVTIVQKRTSPDSIEPKNSKKHKLDKFDILFGNEDVDLRQLPQVDELEIPKATADMEISENNATTTVQSPTMSPKERDWSQVKENKTSPDSTTKKGMSQLDLVRAKLAVATKGKDGLGRQLLFGKTGDKERRRTISSEDTDLRVCNIGADLPPENDKDSIKIIISQAEEEYKEGNINKEQYNTLMYQVMQINERLKLKEAKQRESLEESKRKLQKAHISDDEMDGNSPKRDNTFGDIDERVVPTAFKNKEPLLEQPNGPRYYQDGIMSSGQDSDLRVPNMSHNEMGPGMVGPNMPMQNMQRMHMGHGMFGNHGYHPMWRGPRGPRPEDFNCPRGGRLRGPIPPYFRGKFDKRGPRPFDPRMQMPLPPPSIGMCQGESPLLPYDRPKSPPVLGAPGVALPPTDFRLLEYIDQDPMKTIDIDGVSREIRFYGETGIIMLSWDDPREIKFLSGTRRITFDNKDSIVLGFNEDYITAEVDEQVFNIRFGAPTRELYVNNRWHECFFGGPPTGIVIDGKPRLIFLEGPPPQVDIGKEKRMDLVAGKINLIVDAQHMCPIFLDAKPQKFNINGSFFTIRFVDSLRTVLINETPFKVEFGGLPRPIFVGKSKHFIRFSVLPRNVKPGHIKIANMEGTLAESSVEKLSVPPKNDYLAMEVDQQNDLPMPEKVPTPESDDSNQGGLDMLASVMPTTMAPASQFSGYSLGVPILSSNADGKIPGLDTPADENPPSIPSLPLFSTINVNDLFAKLVATGIVQTLSGVSKENEPSKEEKKQIEEPKPKPVKEDKNLIKPVDLLRSETLRVKQPGIVTKLYGGMQCSGCGTRFPPEHTVRYSQHLDWHFRQNRRERDSARRAHSRHWHYDLSDWVQYEEIEDLEEREKNWFETTGAEGETESPVEVVEGEVPSVPAGAPQDQFCALCGDKFDQFFNEDKEEWHLRKAVRYEENNYHPLCFEDYKASESKAKEEEKESSENEMQDNSVVSEPSVIEMENNTQPIEIKDFDDDNEYFNSQSDNESVVEVIEADSQKEDSQPTLDVDEGDEGEEDDVVLKAEPVEQVVVDDDADTDDETQAERAARDRLAADFRLVRVKQEPIDPDDEPVITAEEEMMTATIDTTSTRVTSSIDGNVQLESTNMVPFAFGGIRLNISKMPVVVNKPLVDEQGLDDVRSDDEPLPPGEEQELDYSVKPGLDGVQLSRQPPVQRGTELSGLCSIM